MALSNPYLKPSILCTRSSFALYGSHCLKLLVRISINHQLLPKRSATAFCSRGSWMSSVCLVRRFAGCSCTSQTVATTSSSVVTTHRLFSARRVFHETPSWARFCSQPTYHPSVSSLPAMASNITSTPTIHSCSWPGGRRLFVPACRRSRPAPEMSNAGLPRTTLCSMPTSQRS